MLLTDKGLTHNCLLQSDNLYRLDRQGMHLMFEKQIIKSIFCQVYEQFLNFQNYKSKVWALMPHRIHCCNTDCFDTDWTDSGSLFQRILASTYIWAVFLDGEKNWKLSFASRGPWKREYLQIHICKWCWANTILTRTWQTLVYVDLAKRSTEAYFRIRKKKSIWNKNKKKATEWIRIGRLTT